MIRRVLLIDEDELFRERLCCLVEQLPISLFVASSVEQALEQLGRSEADCCLLSQGLLDKSKFDSVWEIGQVASGAPVLILASAESCVLELNQRTDVAGSLAKEKISPEYLWLAIGSAMKEKKLLKRIEALQQEVLDFSHTAAHDLKAPIRQARQFAKLYQDDGSPKFFDGLLGSLDRMSNIIAALTAYSEAGCGDRVLRKVDLDSVMRDVVRHFPREDVEFRGSPLPSVIGHKGGLTRLFENLVSNAIKFGGRPLVVSWGAISQPKETQIWVQDNGPGIEPEYFERIFQVFKRLHGKHIPGSGIGLATCRRIAEYHRGRLEVESIVGQGSIFSLFLPRAT